MDRLAADPRRGDTVDYVCVCIRQGIVDGRFVPGQRLIARDLTEEIGISRGAVREAFRRLAAEGMVDLTPNRGASVRRLSRRQVKELFQIRERVEGLAAGLAAAQIAKANNRQTFTDVWEKVRPTGQAMPWNVFIDNNRLYHRAIVEIGGNTQLTALIVNLQLPVVMAQVGRAMRPEHAECSHNDHVAIAEAILAGDSAAAEAAMRKHMHVTHEWIQTLPDSAFKPER
jgi:DNA-binding GntR family transcriptional regulator